MSVNYKKYLEQKFAKKKAEFDVKMAEFETILGDENGGEITPEAKAAFQSIFEECQELKNEIDRLAEIEGFDKPEQKSQPFIPVVQSLSLGEQYVETEGYKAAVKAGVVNGLRVGYEAKGSIRLIEAAARKATFTNTGTGLDSTVNYVNQPVVLLEQQRLTIRDLLSSGTTTQNSIKWIKENSYTNAADMTAEEGEKPEASFSTTTASADVKKIAVVAKVTDEMWSDFPMLRDYVNTRLRFMVESKEEQQLLNGTGSGNQIYGILNTTGIQTQARSSDTNLDAIHKAMTKIRVAAGTAGGYEPDGIVIHPTDYQSIRLSKDANNQYFGGGPLGYGPYGVGGFMEMTPIWGLRTVVTTAISQGTCLVGAFKLGAQIWQRDGIRVDSTNTNEDDFNFNRISLRVEERLALAVYRPSAFCTVTSLN